MSQNNPAQEAGDHEPVPTMHGDPPAGPDEGLYQAPLSCAAMTFLRQSLARQQRRREVFRAQPLRVSLDGKTRWRVDPRKGVGGWFHVPLGSRSLEIFGDDDEGALLLAVFPLPEPRAMADGRTRHLRVALEGGQTVAVDIVLEKAAGRKGRAYVIQLTYADAAAMGEGDSKRPVAETLPIVPRPEPSVVRPPQIATFCEPDDPLAARISAEAQLFEDIRWIQVQAKDLFDAVLKIQAQAHELRRALAQTKKLWASVHDNLQRLREHRQETPWVLRGCQEQDDQGPEIPPGDAP